MCILGILTQMPLFKYYIIFLFWPIGVIALYFQKNLLGHRVVILLMCWLKFLFPVFCHFVPAFI